MSRTVITRPPLMTAIGGVVIVGLAMFGVLVLVLDELPWWEWSLVAAVTVLLLGYGLWSLRAGVVVVGEGTASFHDGQAWRSIPVTDIEEVWVDRVAHGWTLGRLMWTARMRADGEVRHVTAFDSFGRGGARSRADRLCAAAAIAASVAAGPEELSHRMPDFRANAVALLQGGWILMLMAVLIALLGALLGSLGLFHVR